VWLSVGEGTPGFVLGADDISVSHECVPDMLWINVEYIFVDTSFAKSEQQELSILTTRARQASSYGLVSAWNENSFHSLPLKVLSETPLMLKPNKLAGKISIYINIF
jgi:hypothetical protein